MGSRYKPSICWIWLFGILGTGAPNGLAAGETDAPKSPAGTPNLSVTVAPGAEGASPAPNQAAAEPFDFKSIKLGISVDQFRKTPFPHTPSPPDSNFKQGPVRVLCTVVSKDIMKIIYELVPSDDEKAAGVTKCGFYREYVDKKLGTITLSPTRQGFQMGGGGYTSRSTNGEIWSAKLC
jgi:hypothetical protein